MPLYLVTNVCDEGVYDTSFRVVEAPSRLAVVKHIMRADGPWMRWLERSHLLDALDSGSAEQLLARIDATYVDGDSDFQFAIHEVTSVDRVGRPEVPAPGESPHDTGVKDIDPVAFALDRARTYLHWVEEHRASFEAARASDPDEAERELHNLAHSTGEAQTHMARLVELVLAGCTIDPDKRLPRGLQRPRGG